MTIITTPLTGYWHPTNSLVIGDCLDVMRGIPDKCVDLTITDPPYGTNMPYDIYEDTEANWLELMNLAIPEMIRVSKMVIMPCCKIAMLPWIYTNYPPSWLICWYKGSPGHRAYIGFNDWEPHLVYGKTHSRLCMHDFFQTKASPKKGTFDHPCPKPVEWAEWLISRATREGDLIFDPFVGVGTTMVVAKNLKRNYLGCDISASYIETAMRRIETEVIGEVAI